MSGHTPGKWYVDDSRSSCVFVRSDALHRGAYVAIMDQWSESNVNAWPWREAAIANAHLIASAPDMLAALRSARTLINDLCTKHPDDADRFNGVWASFRDEIDAAIAKAEGREP